MRIGLITSNHVRHRYVANILARELDLALVLAEAKKRDPSRRDGTAEEQALLQRYFADRAATEAEMLADGTDWDRQRIRQVEPVPAGEINEPEWARRMEAADVQLVAVFGSSILREPWLARFPGAMVNLHLGLSPYYRGSGTNFWPLYHERPAYVGATIHLIDPGVDSGAILRHARPRIHPEDTPHTIGNRAIREGARALRRSLWEYATGAIAAIPQWTAEDARYQRGADFTPAVLREFLTRWEQGLLQRALAEMDTHQPERLIREMSDE